MQSLTKELVLVFPFQMEVKLLMFKSLQINKNFFQKMFSTFSNQFIKEALKLLAKTLQMY